jgi:hypothetical protein
MATSSLTDAVGLSIVIAAAAFSPEVAQVVGPYVLIAAASVIGASFALARRPPSSRWGALFYFSRVVGLAILLTVGLSAWLSSRYPDFSERALLAPVALVIGFADWPALLGAAFKGGLAAIFKTIDSFRSGGAQ